MAETEIFLTQFSKLNPYWTQNYLIKQQIKILNSFQLSFVQKALFWKNCTEKCFRISNEVEPFLYFEQFLGNDEIFIGVDQIID